jgi:hypothetical protein
MRTTLITALTFTISACLKDDPSTEVDPDVGDPCEASFSMTMADGSSVDMDECKHHGVDVAFATLPEVALPQPHNLSFIFRSTKDTSVDCWVRWDLEGACPDRANYSLGSDKVRLSWNTTGCDVPESAKGSFEAISGSSTFTKMRSQNLEGLAEGDPMRLEITTAIDALAADGTTLSGEVVIDETVDLVYTDFSSCSGSSGDYDLDGYDSIAFGGEDCNDEDPSIGPHANEICDGIDNNCDGQIDEDKTSTFYLDGDGDGWGLEESAYQACGAAIGDVEHAGDCDDTDAAISPDAEEECDGIDNDCDDVIDEGSKIGLYPDNDNDGHGDDDTPPELFCPDDAPVGYVGSFDDCDDEDPDINPDATEVCDGVDNDCDDTIDELPECG